MHVTFISSYVPRKCGLATYTRDLAVETQSKGHQIEVYAMENPVIPDTYTDPVTLKIRQQHREDYIKAADAINSGPTDIVHLQHEFGLYGGTDGEYILELAGRITKPMIVTFHTVLQTPSVTQRKIIQELARISRKVVVMDKIGKNRLETVYGLNFSDLIIILHGAPIIEKANPAESKKKIGYEKKFIVLANNLLSRNKGIEYGIEAVAEALKRVPNLLFLIVGETHPLVKAEEGESYREELITLVKKLHLEEHVHFKNEYVSQEELKTILTAADIYITPYLDPQQTSSGTLSYAIGASKACIATEYVYAKEMLAHDKGVIVPFRDSFAIADAIVNLFEDPEKKLHLETRVSGVSKEMSWPKIADKHLALYKKSRDDEAEIKQNAAEFINSPINITHLMNLTNSNGVIQHSKSIYPDLNFGYSTCDNARALIVATHLYNLHKSEEFYRLIKIYTGFLSKAQKPNGKFHTFLNSALNWEDSEGVTDAYGRVIWGLGFHLYSMQNSILKAPGKNLFEKSLQQTDNILDIRTAAYTILGLYYYMLAYEGIPGSNPLVLKQLMKLGSFIKLNYKKHQSPGWEWFEDNITYDNFRLPQAMFAVYLITGDKVYRDIADASLEFLTKCNFNEDRGYFDFIGQNGWHNKHEIKADYDQQPLEAAGAVDAYRFAGKSFQNGKYLPQSKLAYEWFFGNNRNRRPIYDSHSKGVHDGLTQRGVNINQGAESIICFLMSSLFLQEDQTSVQNYPVDQKVMADFSKPGQIVLPRA